MSYVCAVTSLGRRGGEAAFSPLLLTLEVTPKKETFITLTCGCCGGERRRCVGVLVCVCVFWQGESSHCYSINAPHSCSCGNKAQAADMQSNHHSLLSGEMSE